MRADGSAHRHEGKPVAKVPRTVAVTARGGRHKEQRVPRFARTPTAAQRLGAATPATGSPRAFIFSLENAVCKDSYRPLCGEQPEKPIAPTFSSVRILTEAFSTEKINAGGLRVPAWLSHRCGLAVLAGTSACVGLPLVRQRSRRAPWGRSKRRRRRRSACCSCRGPSSSSTEAAVRRRTWCCEGSRQSGAAEDRGCGRAEGSVGALERVKIKGKEMTALAGSLRSVGATWERWSACSRLGQLLTALARIGWRDRVRSAR